MHLHLVNVCPKSSGSDRVIHLSFRLERFNLGEFTLLISVSVCLCIGKHSGGGVQRRLRHRIADTNLVLHERHWSWKTVCTVCWCSPCSAHMASHCARMSTVPEERYIAACVTGLTILVLMMLLLRFHCTALSVTVLSEIERIKSGIAHTPCDVSAVRRRPSECTRGRQSGRWEMPGECVSKPTPLTSSPDSRHSHGWFFFFCWWCRTQLLCV